MKLFIFDKDKSLIEQFNYYNKMHDGVMDILSCYSYDDALSLYENNKFDLVIIDFSESGGSDFLNYVLKQKPTQKIITLSYTLDCSEQYGCSFCLENYNKKRLLKPVDFSEILLNTLKDDISCSGALCVKENMIVARIKKEIEHQDVTFDEEQMLLKIGQDSQEQDKSANMFFKISSSLEPYNINNEVIDISTMKLIPLNRFDYNIESFNNRIVSRKDGNILIADVHNIIKYHNDLHNKIAKCILLLEHENKCQKQSKNECFTTKWIEKNLNKESALFELLQKTHNEYHYIYEELFQMLEDDQEITEFKYKDLIQASRILLNEFIELLKYMAMKFTQFDKLTQIYTRGLFIELANNEIQRAKRQKQEFCLVMADIDNFKIVNDTYGHSFGDLVLKEVVQSLRLGLREYDVIGRWGGEEFIIILPDTMLDKAIDVVERIRLAVEDRFFSQDNISVGVTLTFGITEYNEKYSLQNMIDEADRLLYIGKENGKNKIIS